MSALSALVRARLASRMIALIALPTLAINASAEPPARMEQVLISITNPPPVRMLVPGFTVRELPLVVNNINNLVFAPDGRLFALCYDGNVLQLKDTDSDGLEDTATYFYRNDKRVILPSIGMCWGPGGLYIASQGRVIRLRDKGDGTGELETVTGDWVKPTGAAGSNLDSIGIAADRQGTIYFGLGCDKWNEAYRVNQATGKSDYNIHSERGTILKILPDGRREVICTGMRFPVSLAFNAAGDLFCTDQEGATWLPNGNPFDELLHIQPGRHYGFPPRHPKYLPNVSDEPSTFDYMPQHQSTCGLHFNDGKKVFGPEWWRGDAFIAGESRGKIWRTKLVKTATGYVAQNNLIACLSMLTLDAVPTPQGDLLVCCHSGQPDWGTGPEGKGKLFKISYTDKSAPQPRLIHPDDAKQWRVVFDRKLTARIDRHFSEDCQMSMGRYVTAGERFESFRPGYQVVKLQRTMPRFALPIRAAQMDKARHALVLQSSGADEAVNYALTLPGHAAGSLEEIDLLGDLTGAAATWKAAGENASWTGWLPHLDLGAARGFTIGSAGHDQLFKTMQSRGTLHLRAQLDLDSILHPAVQPESKLDFEYPPERVTVVFKANQPVRLSTAAQVKQLSEREVQLVHCPVKNSFLPVEIKLATGNGDARLDVSWFTDEDARPRPLPLRRILLPWARPYLAVAEAKPTPELAGGDWERGRRLYFSEQPGCFKCHTIGQEGGEIGPNLSNLIYRDYASVFRDITQPSAAINPDHLAFNVTLKDGEVESGVILKNNREEVVLGQANGKELKIPRDRVASLKASAVSVMPEDLLKPLSPEQQRDLLTFLLTPAPTKSP